MSSEQQQLPVLCEVLEFARQFSQSKNTVSNDFVKWVAQHRRDDVNSSALIPSPSQPTSSSSSSSSPPLASHPIVNNANGDDMVSVDVRTAPLAAQVEMTKWEERIACLLLFFFPGIVVWLILFPLLCLLLMPWWMALLFVVTIVVIFSLVPESFVPDICRSYMLRLFAKYFSLRVAFFRRAELIKEPQLYTSRRYLFAYMPHGVFPVGDMLSLFAFHSFGRRIPRYAVATPVMYTPILRMIFMLHGAILASHEEMVSKLVDEQDNVAVNVHGITGIYESPQQKVDIRNRRGFLRVAAAAGQDVQVVPVYVFGNTECMKTIFAGNALCQRISRFLRFPICWPYGRWYLPIPKRVPITIAIGEPFKTTGNADQDLVTFSQSIRSLYASASPHYGWSNNPLTLSI